MFIECKETEDVNISCFYIRFLEGSGFSYLVCV